MGCFNTACAVTGKSIRHNDEVVGFIIIKNNDHYAAKEEYLVYPWDKYTIASLPIHGKYDDYGSIDEIETDSSAIKNLQRLFPSGKFLDDDTLSHELTREPWLAVNGVKYHLGLMMVSKPAYDHIIKKNLVKGGREAFTNLYNHLKNELDKADTESMYVKLWKEESIRNLFNLNFDNIELLREFGTNSKAWDAPNSLAGTRAMSYDSCITNLVHRIDRFDSIELTDDVLDHFEQWNEVRILGNGFLRLGRQFVPSLYVGQDDNHDDLIDLNLMMILNLLDTQIKWTEDVIFEYQSGVTSSTASKYAKRFKEFHEKVSLMLEKSQAGYNEHLKQKN